MIDYHNKRFRVLSNSSNGEIPSNLLFHYQQKGNVLTCTYSGGEIVLGQLIGMVEESGKINIRYHQINTSGEINTGTCISTPEILENGKIRLYEEWQWTSGHFTKGYSTLEEL